MVRSVLTGLVLMATTPSADADGSDQRGKPGASDPIERLARKDGALAHRRDRRNGRRTEPRIDARKQRHENPGGERNDDRARLEHEARVRKREADGVEQLEQALGQQEAEEEADDRCDNAHDESLHDHRAEDLAVRRADRPERRELPRALGDRDRQRVGDDERADEERDPSEREEEGPEEGDELVRVLGIRLRLLTAGLYLCGARQDPLDLGDELGIGDARLRGDGDLVELSDLLEEPLRRGQVEARERRPSDREARAELDDARDTHSLDRSFGLHADRLPDLEILLGRRLLVDDDLVPARPAALDQRQRVEDRGAVRDRETEVRGASGDDRLPVVPDELRRVRVDTALGLGDGR